MGQASFRRLFTAAILVCSCCLSLEATTLLFSGSVAGTASEDLQGRCAPLITVNAGGSGSSNLLGNFVDVQSHCTTGPSSFGTGLFTLTSQSAASDSLFGTYSGTAALGSGGVLNFSALLTVSGGSGTFAGASGTLNSTGTLDRSGGFAATFAGSVTTAPEPGTTSAALAGLALCAFLRCRTHLTNRSPQ